MTENLQAMFFSSALKDNADWSSEGPGDSPSIRRPGIRAPLASEDEDILLATNEVFPLLPPCLFQVIVLPRN